MPPCNGSPCFPCLNQCNAVLERSTLGIPHSALPLLATALALVALAAAAVPWWSDRAVPAILGWLSNGKEAARRPRRRAAVR